MQDLKQFKNEMNLSGKNVYVGHRYKPKMFGDWDNTQLYEPLSIVQYQGNSFTSRQYVPSGVEITNEEYWASTGNYNAQIEQYRQDVRNLENNVNNVNDEVITARNGEETLSDRLEIDKQEIVTRLTQTETDLSQDRINVMSHGLYGDGVTDDTQALKDLISELTDSDTLFFPKGYRFNVSDTINFPRKINIIMESPIVYTGLENIPVMVVGEKGIENKNVYLQLMAENQEISDWSNENSKAIQVINLYESHLIIKNTLNTTIGVELIGSGSGFVYNTVVMYSMYSHKIGLKLTNEKHDGDIGWMNENLFLNGRFGQYSGQKLNQSRYGVWITSEDQTYTNNNNNLFIKPSFELNVHALETTGEAIPIVVEHGSQNEFYSIRNEGNSKTTSRFMNTSTGNYVSIGYGNGKIDDVSTNTMNYLKTRRQNFSNWTQVFNSGSLTKHAVIDGDSVSFDNVNTLASTNGTPLDSVNSITPNDTSISMATTRGVSVRLHTSDIDMIAVKRDSLGNGRVAIAAYDDEGNRLTGSSPRYIKSPAAVQLSPHDSFGGVYRTGSDNNEIVSFSTDDEVSYVDVMFLSGDLRGFTIETYGGTSIPYKV